MIADFQFFRVVERHALHVLLVVGYHEFHGVLFGKININLIGFGHTETAGGGKSAFKGIGYQ